MSSLLETMLGQMTSESSLSALTGKTGGSADQVSGMLSSALPTLMKAMNQNASSAEGAASLAGALTQHTSSKAVAEQIAETDEVDGSKIIQHILGGSMGSVVDGLTKSSGMNAEQVSRILSSIAPALLSGMSSAAKQAKTSKKTGPKFDLSDGLGLEDVAALLAQSKTGKTSKTSKTSSADNAEALLGLLGSLMK